MITLDVTFHRRLVRASVGDLIRVDLPEDAITGSRWALPEALPAELRLVKDKTARSSFSADGSVRRLELRVVKKGYFRMSLEQAGTWRSSEALFEIYIEARAVESEPRLEPPPPSSRRPHTLGAALQGRSL